ncbi:PREDICTED: phospholipase A2 inhibitor and Ly6/PLAUR domain-containing protein-like isoform X2 [Gekko japonicus]|uniref:Phospholipase A2 inhibitor and Ly6/PLAUR domain-containing protein-like isoform X1 n=1 Tax=Gekko japonicus TaxID=146911 RepID=A0ABM1K2D0_GEKJA|nr:PREDICTED: phospholipase A2 inhibitor and Ly6/PLAUR domain-containing protein-like isoform X1 [Gekko japonicus]XP_015267867.1 PREDICTED: phospholipase A2 inhibitor and Ly6/PLAUR domain-containing protein-like isoform X2 [Gekko japonicus]
MTCPAGLDSCAVGLTESSVGPVRVEVIVKGCTSSDSCKKGPIYANFGRGKARGSVICCTGTACQRASPQLPPINATANGMRCPACYSLSSSCVTEVAYCTGSEIYCMDAHLHNDAGVLMDTTMKGCASEQICFGLKTGINSFGKAQTGHCRAANKGSPVSGSILLVLSGILATKVFF